MAGDLFFLFLPNWKKSFFCGLSCPPDPGKPPPTHLFFFFFCLADVFNNPCAPFIGICLCCDSPPHLLCTRLPHSVPNLSSDASTSDIAISLLPCASEGCGRIGVAVFPDVYELSRSPAHVSRRCRRLRLLRDMKGKQTEAYFFFVNLAIVYSSVRSRLTKQPSATGVCARPFVRQQ